MVRGASLARGAGRAGIGWSGDASVGAVSTAGAVLTGARVAVPPFVRLDTTRLLRLDCVAAELVAQGGEHLGPVRVVLA